MAYAQTPADPNSIKYPEGTKIPIKLKCPIHGMIGKDYVAIEADGQTKLYCSKCARILISRFFDENLPKLEVVK